MNSHSDVMLLRAETPIHVGSGRSREDADSALRRERSTEYPFVPAATVKGAIRHRIEHTRAYSNRIPALFGPCRKGEAGSDSARASAIFFSNARLLFFPVRSAGGAASWITCPRILAHFRRDLASSVQAVSWNVPEPRSKALGTKENQCRIGSEIQLGEHAFEFGCHAAMDDLAEWLRKHIPFQQSPTRSRQDRREADCFASRLLALPDGAFADMVGRSTEVHLRVGRGAETKAPAAQSSGVLFQEHLPYGTFLYCRVLACGFPHSADYGSDYDGDKKHRQHTATSLLDFIRWLGEQHLHIGSGTSLGKGITFVRFVTDGTTCSHG